LDFKPVGCRIRAARESKHLSQKELGKMVHLTHSHISVLERGMKTTPLRTLIDIANALNVSVDSLLIDKINTAAEIRATQLSEKIEALPLKEQAKIIKVVHVLAEKDEEI